MSEPHLDIDDEDSESLFDFLDEEATDGVKGSPHGSRSSGRSEAGDGRSMPIIRRPVPVSESGALRAPSPFARHRSEDDVPAARRSGRDRRPGGLHAYEEREARPPSKRARLSLLLLALAFLGTGLSMFLRPDLLPDVAWIEDLLRPTDVASLPLDPERPPADLGPTPAASGSPVSPDPVAGPPRANSLGERFRRRFADVESLIAQGNLDEAANTIATLDRAVYGYGIAEFGELESRIASLRAGGAASGETPPLAVQDGSSAGPADIVRDAGAEEAERREEAERAIEAERIAEAERAAEAAREAEAARLAEVERVEAERAAEAAREAEAARLAEAERAEAERAAEAAREAEAARLAEAERVEAERVAEAAREAEAARLAEAERAEAERVAEAAREAEAARLAEAERQAERAEAERVAEAAREAEAARLAEAERQAERAEAERAAEASRLAREERDRARQERAAAARAEREAAAAEARAAAREAARRRAEGDRSPVTPTPPVASGGTRERVLPVETPAAEAGSERRATSIDADRRATDRRIAEQLAARQRREAAERELAEQRRAERLAAEESRRAEAAAEAAVTAPFTGITDTDLQLVYERFANLVRAIENRDIAAVMSLTENSGARVQQLLQVFENSESLDARITNVSARSADRAITGTLRIETIRRADGSRVPPPPALQAVALTSTRDDGVWSAFDW